MVPRGTHPKKAKLMAFHLPFGSRCFLCNSISSTLISCLAGNWLQEHTDLRDKLNGEFSVEGLRQMAQEMLRRIESCGRTVPQPKMSERARLRLEQENVKRQRIEEQARIESVEQGLEVSNLLVLLPAKHLACITVSEYWQAKGALPHCFGSFR